MAEKNEKAGVDTTVAKPDSNIVSKKQRGLAAKEDGQVSQALRTVYQRAVDEDIPLEMLDLLKKLD